MSIPFLRFPFLGSQEDGESFQYLLLAIDQKGAEISIQDWLVKRGKLHPNEKVDLSIPFYDGRGKTIAYEDGIYQIAFEKPLDIISLENIFRNSNQNAIKTVVKLIKDSLFLKSGIRIYLKHLIPYFSRIVDYSKKEYQQIKNSLLQDVLKRVVNNEERLIALQTLLQEKLTEKGQIPIFIDLEEIRNTLESEISLPLFNLAFSENKLELMEQFQVQSEFGYSKYIHAIKQLERRLYSNYNKLVILYLNSL